MLVYGRLRPGVNLKQAAAETKGISQQLAQMYPDSNRTCTLVADTEVGARSASNPLDITLLVGLLSLSGVVLLKSPAPTL
jgi:hypothetical protein